MTTSPALLLNSFYDSGTKMGGILAAVFVFLMIIEMIYVFVKYVVTSDK